MTELSKRPNYRADIQGLRGVAVLLVVLFHAGLPVSGGFIGVDVFFVISGFVIAQGIVRGLEKGTFSFRTFYVKRMRRLLPALTVMLSTVMALLLLLGPTVAHHAAGRTGVAAALFNANHYLLLGRGYFDPHVEYNAFLHTWSLSVEEQFYFAFPLMLFVLWRAGRATSGKTRILWGIGLVSVLSLCLSFWLSYTPRVFRFSGESLAFYTMVSRAWQFGVGALISLSAARLAKSPLANVHLVWVGLVMIVAGSVLFDSSTVFPGVAVLLPTFGAALVITAGLKDEGTSYAARALRSRGMVRLGDLSYSWYLWHWPLIVFAAATFPHVPLQASIIAAVASLGVAVLNERYVESPIRFRPEGRHWPALVMFVACVATPVIVWSFAQNAKANRLQTAQSSAQTLSVAQQVVLTQNEYETLPCNGVHTPKVPAEGCRWGAGSKRRVHLVGDSNARQWLSVLRELIPEMGVELTATTLASCPFVHRTQVYDGKAQERCSVWVERVLDELREFPPDIVIISNAADGYVYESERKFRSADSPTLTLTENERSDVYENNLRETVAMLKIAGSEVVVVAPVPKFTRSERYERRHRYATRREQALAMRCSWLVLKIRSSWCQVYRDTKSDDWFDAILVSTLHNRLRQEQVVVLDPAEELCSSVGCPLFSEDGSLVNYYDSGHIAGDGARMLRDSFQSEIERQLRLQDPSEQRRGE